MSGCGDLMESCSNLRYRKIYSSAHDCNTPNISYRRKSPKQVKRDKERVMRRKQELNKSIDHCSEIEMDRKCDSSSIMENDFKQNISACYITKNRPSGIDQLDSFSEPISQVGLHHSDLLKDIPQSNPFGPLENTTTYSDNDNATPTMPFVFVKHADGITPTGYL